MIQHLKILSSIVKKKRQDMMIDCVDSRDHLIVASRFSGWLLLSMKFLLSPNLRKASGSIPVSQVDPPFGKRKL
ncbi:MAG: hypothetical protein EA367_00360, partial [Leptolyngbya sp. DLM2.Bin15]